HHHLGAEAVDRVPGPVDRNAIGQVTPPGQLQPDGDNGDQQRASGPEPDPGPTMPLYVVHSICYSTPRTLIAWNTHHAAPWGLAFRPENTMPKILIADDSETITTLLTTALESNGYEVSVASDGHQAYQLGIDSEHDLAILDQLMPG